MTGTVTYAQLDQLLATLGFHAASAKGRAGKAYRHGEAGTMIVVGMHGPTEAVRGADVVSVRRHLVEGGLLDENTFDEFACTGAIPAGK